MNIHQYSNEYALSDIYSLTANGQNVPVLKTNVSDFATIDASDADGSIEFVLTVKTVETLNQNDVKVSPSGRNIKADVSGNSVKFLVDRFDHLAVEIGSVRQDFVLFFNDESEVKKVAAFTDFYAVGANGENLVREEIDKDDINVLYFAAGGVYEVGMLELKSNQTMFIESGAVVRGAIYTVDAENVRITGGGILDADKDLCNAMGLTVADGIASYHTIQTNNSKNIVIENITIINPPCWVVVLGGSENVLCNNVRILGFFTSTDGIDVVGTSNVLIRKCFIQDNDDSIVIKSFQHPWAKGDNWQQDVVNVLCEKNTFMGHTGGSIFEIGHEIFCDRVDNIIFRDSEVISCHGFGAVFSLQHCGCAEITKILYEDITIDHCYDKLLNLRTMWSRYSKMYSPTEDFGHVDGVTFRNIYWQTTTFNEGYTVSLIGGADAEHIVENILFDGFYVDGKRAECIEDLNIFVRNCKNIEFC